jgi:di/tricarboxylate transporter
MLPAYLEPYAIIVILILSMCLFIWNKWRFDISALCTLGAAALIGAVPLKEIYSGFDNSAVITVACVMIISEIINSSGILSTLISKLNIICKNTFVHISLMCILTALLSAFMNNIGALTLMMPIAIQTSIENKRSPSLILMPLAMASAMGGLTTLIGTPPNILIASYREKALGTGFSMFDFSHAGLLVAVVGVFFIVLIGWRLVPKRASATKDGKLFEIEDYMTELKVPEYSKVIDMTVNDFRKLVDTDYELLGIIRKNQRLFRITQQLVIEKNDILIIEANATDIEELVKQAKLDVYGDHATASADLGKGEMSIVEVVVPPGCGLTNRTWQDARIRQRFQANLIALSRKGKPSRQRLNHNHLQAGDILLIQGPEESIDSSIKTLGLLPLENRNISLSKLSLKSYLPILLFIASIIAISFQLVPVAAGFGAAILLMVLTGCTRISTIYNSIDWPIIILLAAMIPIGNALVSTGGAGVITKSLLSMTHLLNPTGMLILLLIITMTLSDFMNNVVTTVVMAPIAVSLAHQLGVAIDPFLMAVAIGASCSFLTPIGHQNNTLVMGPGGYKFSDYIRLGLPLEIIIVIVSIPMILWMWPLHP